ncbi:hypothetical protein F3Y22_tig00110239pilonHSYRG00386 [Hibiscus syriacus]|uniref:Methyltransferase n=1 Tax=Hibiscus syriacus TaxID=106335 RepID=A0A6A3BC45_HIBSY|nr:hypothetical protein F3Y22_tig00110239pilonHSYRG00386 [Hibiscus syriacus]
MALARFGRQVKRQHGVCVKMTAVAILDLCFIFVWSIFSSPSTSVTVQSENFDDIAEPVASSTMVRDKDMPKVSSEVPKENQEKQKQEESQGEEAKKETEMEGDVVVDGNEEGLDGEEEKGEIEGDADLVESVEQEPEEMVEKRMMGRRERSKAGFQIADQKFDSGCDIAGYGHRERTCPKAPPMCLVPLSHDGNDSPVHWPESKLKILYKNVAHPKLAAYLKNHDWLIKSGEYLMFPQNRSEFKSGVVYYHESIEEASLSCSMF